LLDVIPCISIPMSLYDESEKNLIENSGLHGVYCIITQVEG